MLQPLVSHIDLLDDDKACASGGQPGWPGPNRHTRDTEAAVGDVGGAIGREPPVCTTRSSVAREEKSDTLALVVLHDPIAQLERAPGDGSSSLPGVTGGIGCGVARSTMSRRILPYGRLTQTAVGRPGESMLRHRSRSSQPDGPDSGWFGRAQLGINITSLSVAKWYRTCFGSRGPLVRFQPLRLAGTATSLSAMVAGDRRAVECDQHRLGSVGR